MTSTDNDSPVPIAEAEQGRYVRVPFSELERIRIEIARLRALSPVMYQLHQQLVALCQKYKQW